ncbi:hypothetical protein [Streptomyces sp. NPDC054765]
MEGRPGARGRHTTVLQHAGTTPSSTAVLAGTAAESLPAGVLNVVCAYHNAGQDCTALTRFLVHHRRCEALVAAFAAVRVNTRGTTVPEMPHGGVKHSGYGSDLSLAGLLDHTRAKHVMR